jgi:HAD superfamily hydrolase (TIGR01549 family)
MDHINFFLQEVEKSRRQIPDNVSVDGYMKFASTNYMMLHYLCQQHSIDFYPLVSKQEFFTECVKKRKEELKNDGSIGKNGGKKVKKSMEKREEKKSMEKREEKKSMEKREEKKEQEIKLVIFDKDGTLVHNNFLFQEYCTKVINTFKNDVDDIQKFGEKLGFDMKENKFIPGGLMSMSSGQQVCQKVTSILGNKYSLLQIEEKLSRLETSTETTIVEFTDTKELFVSLKKKGIKIGVCTSDDRKNALNHLARIGVLKLVDYLKCGDDNKINKPSPEPIHEICAELGVSPRNTCMVGDTFYDIHSATLANCGRIIGVLSGDSIPDQLQESDIIIKSIASFFL